MYPLYHAHSTMYNNQPPLASTLLRFLQECKNDVHLPNIEQPEPFIPSKLHVPRLPGQIVYNGDGIVYPLRDVFLTADDNSWGPSLPPSAGSVFRDPLDELFPESSFCQPIAPIEDLELTGPREDPHHAPNSPEGLLSQACISVSAGHDILINPIFKRELTFYSSISDATPSYQDPPSGFVPENTPVESSPENRLDIFSERASSANADIEQNCSNTDALNSPERTLNSDLSTDDQASSLAVSLPMELILFASS
ncbi:hypothetical protein CPB83DRAFT_856109 [Crepidotus variabilis]|uniref:Uncharacterized protein n=1 Tax=Crepidotus variabilis TaxID=179855 RepID=A0A9P6EE32_9AGAR|nr:hypothetical protein CPB83DRAFT_856109 [Crepidotus variabilis]